MSEDKHTDEANVEPVVADDLLVEEVSIDGMRGVC
jgi:mycofactocin precursor